MRLPPLPALSWTTDEDAPHSDDVGDVYFSGDGLAEKRAVFLTGCELPETWAGRGLFVVGELGFGAGINLLALWDLWRRNRPHPHARLHMISVEGALMPAADAARVHARWPDLSGLSAGLIMRWPHRARGLQRIDLPDGITLDILIDDVAAALPQLSARMDAWFLDGFAPSKNPAMWTAGVIAHVARLSAPGARLASYTVAGELRRALADAGFSVSKLPGHGRKKERLEATYLSPRSSFTARPDFRRDERLKGRMERARATSAIVIGAGVAGAWAAQALRQRGIAVTVLDAAHPGAGASGNALALVMPRLDATDTPAARALIAAFLFARRAWTNLPADAAATLDVRRLAGSATEAARFARLMADPPLDSSLLSSLDADAPSAGLIHQQCIVVKPAAALPALLAGAQVRTDARVIAVAPMRANPQAAGARVTLGSGETLDADLVIVCAGAELHALAGLALPPVAGRLGQIEHGQIEHGQIEHASLIAPAHAIADGGYVVSAFGDLVFGATFEPAPETWMAGPIPVTDAARAENLATLARLAPHLHAENLNLVSRASVRATTPDRLPFAGAPPASQPTADPAPDPAPDKEKAPEQPPAPSGPGESPAIRSPVMLVGGLGARGFLWAPLLAELVVAQALGEPLPVETRIADLLDPDRFRRRARKL